MQHIFFLALLLVTLPQAWAAPGGRAFRFETPANNRMQQPPGEFLVYMRIKTQGSVIFDVEARSLTSFYDTKAKEYAFLYTMFGILIVMALYNFLIWIQLRKITYLIYVGFILSVFIQFIIVSGLIVHHLEQPAWIMNVGYLYVANASLLLACIFPIYFLSLANRECFIKRAA